MLVRLQSFLSFIAILGLQGCATAASGSQSVDWNNINYAEIVCGKGKSTNPDCKSKDDDLSSIGRSGKGK